MHTGGLVWVGVGGCCILVAWCGLVWECVAYWFLVWVGVGVCCILVACVGWCGSVLHTGGVWGLVWEGVAYWWLVGVGVGRCCILVACGDVWEGVAY